MLRNICQIYISNFIIDKYDYEKIYSISDEEFIVKNNKTGEKMIMLKIFDFQIPKNPDKFNNSLYRTLLPNLIHIPGVSKIKGFDFPLNHQTDDAFIFSEFVSDLIVDQINQNYFELKGQNTILNPTIRSKIIFGIASIMKRLHQHQIIHGYLRTDTIYLDKNNEPRIFSTGIRENLNVFIDRSVYHTVGLSAYPYHFSPEVICDCDESSLKSDVYSFSFVLFLMFSNKLLFEDSNCRPSVFAWFSKIANGERPVKQDSIPDVYWSLIQKCWNQDPEKRPTFNEIVEILKDDQFAINEFGMKTDLNELHEYQERIENCFYDAIYDFNYLRSQL